MENNSDKALRKAMTRGIVFRPEPAEQPAKRQKVRTKAKKKAYVTGVHGSGAARMKAQIRKRRAMRKSQQHK